MELALPALAIVVGILAVLQGWQMVNARRKRNNNPSYGEKLDIIITQLSRMEQRLNDIWEGRK